MKHWLDFFSDYGQPRNQLDSDDGWLLARDDWPSEFQLFLNAVNGRDFECTDKRSVRIPIPWNDRPFIHDQITCVYGQKQSNDPAERGWLTATDISMPKNTFAIAKFESSSLAVLSVRPEDYGKIYYWDWYMNYPWRGDFYKNRLQPVYEQFGNELDKILDAGDSHPKYVVLNKACNNALLVNLADSFSEFIRMIEDEPNDA